MSPVWFITMLVLVFLVVAMLTSPWRRRGAGDSEPTDGRARQAAVDVEDLEAARDAKYREIRDTELDRQTGKLSEADFAAIDGGLRAEAVEILRRLDRAQRRLDKLRGVTLERQVPADIDVAADDENDPASEGAPTGYHQAS